MADGDRRRRFLEMAREEEAALKSGVATQSDSATSAPAPPEASPQVRAEAFQQSFMQNLPFGFGDEIGGVAGMLGAKSVGDSRPWGELYTEARDDNRANLARLQQAAPAESMAGIVGSALVPLGGAGGAVGKATQAGSLLSRMGRGAVAGGAVGAGYGAASGLGNSVAETPSGMLDDTLAGGELGAKIGAGVGAAGPAVGAGLQAVSKRGGVSAFIGDAVESIPGIGKIVTRWRQPAREAAEAIAKEAADAERRAALEQRQAAASALMQQRAAAKEAEAARALEQSQRPWSTATATGVPQPAAPMSAPAFPAPSAAAIDDAARMQALQQITQGDAVARARALAEQGLPLEAIAFQLGMPRADVARLLR